MHSDTTTPEGHETVRKLDNALNDAILSAYTNAEAHRVWSQKLSAKRLLAGIPPDMIPAAADTMLRNFQTDGAV